MRVEFRRSSSLYQLRASLVNDGNTWSYTNWFTISDTSHLVELNWAASTLAGANNGGLTLWIDGNSLAVLSGVDNDTRKIDRLRLGAVAGIDSGTRGAEYFDSFESRRVSYIGWDVSVETSTPSYTSTVTPSHTPTPTSSLVPTSTYTDTSTVSPTVAPTQTPSLVPTSSPTSHFTPSQTPVVDPTDTPWGTPSATSTPIMTSTPVAGGDEQFENIPSTWIIETDTNGSGSIVDRTLAQNRSGMSSAVSFTTNSNAKAQIRDIIPSAWSSIGMDTSSYIWQRAFLYVPSATVASLSGSEYIDLGGLYGSGSSSGFFLRLKASGALYASGPGSSGQSEFNLNGSFPLDRWVEVELGLWSRNSGDLDRAGCFIVDGRFYGWFTNGASGTNYDRAAMGIVATNSSDDLTVYVDDWYLYSTSSLPTGTDNRPTGNIYTLDYTQGSGENVGYHYTTWENGFVLDPLYGLSPSSRIQSAAETSRMPDLSNGWSQIVIDWSGNRTPPWKPDLMGQFFAPMIGFRKSVELEENLEIVPVYRSGSESVDLVFESWTLGPIEYAAWQLPMDASGHRLPGQGDIIRVRWQEVSATEIRVRVDYYDASETQWLLDVIDHTEVLNNVNGVNFLADSHRAVTNTIDSNDYTIKSQTIGILSTFP